MIQISPSILAADFANLQSEAAAMKAAGAHMLHIDIMDGHFVPNLSIGLPVVESLRRRTDLPLDVHLMVSDPLTYAPRFADAGADILVFHVECDSDPHTVIEAIRGKGKLCGMSLKPGTPPESLFPYLDALDMILVMTVEPGFGGQRFMEAMCPKIETLRAECTRRGLTLDIEVDGGIDIHTISRAAHAGANVFVAGSALFGKPDYRVAIQELLHAAQANGGC